MIDIYTKDKKSEIETLYDDNNGKGYTRDEAVDKIRWLKQYMKLARITFIPKDRNFIPIDIDDTDQEQEDPFTIEHLYKYGQEVYPDTSEEWNLIPDDGEDCEPLF